MWREQDSNLRRLLTLHTFQACALNHSATSPIINYSLEDSSACSAESSSGTDSEDSSTGTSSSAGASS